MITGNQLEVLVALVLGLDAVVIAGIVISRLTGRRANRNEAAGSSGASVAVQDAPYSRLAGAVGSVPASPPDLAAVETSAETSADTSASLEAPPSVAETDARAFAELAPPRSVLAPAPVESDGDSRDEMPPYEATDAPESGGVMAAERPEPEEAPESPAVTRAPAPPVGLDFGPTWVDPLTLAATAAAEWRHGLRRDLARAAHRGRPATVMHLKLDIGSRPSLSIQEVAHLEGLLLDILGSLVRATDHVDRTGPARFHMILSEMPEAGALAVAERMRHAFAESAPDGPRLLIGWAVMETEADIALALQRAAERIDDGGASAWDAGMGR